MRCKRTGKLCFKTKESALCFGVRAMFKPKWKTKLVRAYYCQFCKKWHITSQVQNDKNKYNSTSLYM